MQRARHETPLPPPPLPQEYDDEPEYAAGAGASVASLRGPAAAAGTRGIKRRPRRKINEQD